MASAPLRFDPESKTLVEQKRPSTADSVPLTTETHRTRSLYPQQSLKPEAPESGEIIKATYRMYPDIPDMPLTALRYNRRFIFVADTPIPEKETLKQMKIKFGGKIVQWQPNRFMNRFDLSDMSIFIEIGLDVVGIWLDLNNRQARRWLERVLTLHGHLHSNAWVIAVTKTDNSPRWCDTLEPHIKLRRKDFNLWAPVLIDGKLREPVKIYAPKKWYHQLGQCLLNFLIKRTGQA